ncbi:MAG: 16S rRNA (guanine(966)-N(2))-methyltransferase RsmD [Proteobacteria bacterium]|nr:16S rRNA (guanine(966)-N(2))-methyltransferase RsmD [Pseudomonadota bacterium]
MVTPRSSPASGKLRIIGGSLRGSRLAVPDAPGLRPTSDRIRETLFNWLAPVIEGAVCLDLFAGTGALGIEALSRGATSVDFVEADARLAALLRENLARLRQDARVHAADALHYPAKSTQRFDLVFLDPPFASGLWNAAAQALETHGRLRDGAWIYVESPADSPPDLPAHWQLHREGRAGAVRYALYRRGEPSAKL